MINKNKNKKKQKIPLLIVSLGQKYGGAEKYTLNLISSLQEYSYDIHVAVREDGGLVSKIKNCHLVKFNLDKKNIIASIYKFRRYVDYNNIAIIHCNGINAMFFALFLKKGIRKIAVIHGDTGLDHKDMGFIKSKVFPAAEVLFIKNFDKCVVVSESLKEVLLKRGVKSYKTEVIYNGIELYNYKSYADINNQVLKICNVGNLLKVKGQIFLLKALKYLKNNYPEIKCECDIYGIGDCYRELYDFINRNHLSNVYLKGFDDSVRNKLNNYNVYVQPSFYESFGLSVVEAINAGCYVIGSDTGGIKEILDILDCGETFHIGDYKEIALIIKKLYENRELLANDKLKTIEKIRYKFSNIVMVDKLDKIYRGNSYENKG